MKKKILKQLSLKISKYYFTILLGLLSLWGCTDTPGKKELKEAQKEILASNYPAALELFHKITRLYPKEEISLRAAREGASACEKQKGCEYSEYFYKKIIEDTSSESELLEAQKKLALYYYDKGIYTQAIQLMNMLLSKTNFKNDKLEIRLKLARSYFYLKNFFQSDVELSLYLNEAKESDKIFEGQLLRADILSAQKKYIEAGAVYRKIKEENPNLYIKNQVYLSEALMYEDQKMLDQAISTLEALPEIPNKEFISIKIDRLKERRALMPGASGLRR